MRLAKAVILSATSVLVLTSNLFCQADAGAFRAWSSAIPSGATIPKQYTGEGQDMSPPMQWTTPPAGTKSLAITCEDPDAPKATWWHWIIYNIPATLRGLGQGVAKTPSIGAVGQGTNDFNRVGYNGPMPPPGQTHRYQFKVLALNSPLSLSPGCTKASFQSAVQGHVLGEAQFTGKYSR